VSSPVYFRSHTNVIVIFCVAYSENAIPLAVLRIRFQKSVTEKPQSAVIDFHLRTSLEFVIIVQLLNTRLLKSLNHIYCLSHKRKALATFISVCVALMSLSKSRMKKSRKQLIMEGI